jgi:FKBP-type peptidyl-prolyl cis-trans isomerase FkpA
MKRGILTLCASVVLLALLAPVAWSQPQDSAFRTLDGGVKSRTLSPGEGPPAATGMVATIHVKGWVNESGARGRELYDTRRDGDVISFVIGTNNVMPAWNVGVVGMRAGERRMLLVPPAMGYGNQRVEGVVEPNTPLMLQIELVRLAEE